MGSVVAAFTPVQRAAHVSAALGAEVWIKRDDLTDPRYGGNKVRKLAHLLAEAQAREATDLVTAGAIGSHHVLATALHARTLGLPVHAVVAPRPFSAHALETARASLAQGARLLPVDAMWQAPARMALEMARLRARGRRPFLLTVGGSSPRGSLGYLEAVAELVAQRGRGALPAWPEVMVCPLGSGGTCAGLLAGVQRYGVPSTVVGVQVSEPWMPLRPLVAWLASRALALAAPTEPVPRDAREVQVLRGQMGGGYGHATEAAREAMELFARDGIELDETYTAKAAAGLIALARRDRRPRRYLFWHTLSSAPMEPLLTGAPVLPAPLAKLFR
jgi:1-aminocyclopropane-1-carboxylate deaminase/D-cysteine desulfhydrase-like pyridoxal-dependent ACC family enzyme